MNRANYFGAFNTLSTYKTWAQKAEDDFKAKFKVSPEEADNIHQKFKGLYEDTNMLKDSMLAAIKNVSKDISEANKGSKGRVGFVHKALNGKTRSDRKAATKKLNDYLDALQRLYSAIGGIDGTVLLAKDSEGNNSVNVSSQAMQMLGHSATATSAYINARNAQNALSKAMKNAASGKNDGLINYDTYRAYVNKASNEVIADKIGTSTIEASKFAESIENSLSLVLGEYAEGAIADALRTGLDEIKTAVKTGKNIVEATTNDDVKIKLSVKKLNHGVKTTSKTMTVGQLIADWDSVGVGQNQIFEYLILNATAHSYLGHDAFSRGNSDELKIHRLLEYMAACSANYAIGQDVDYIFYNNAVFHKSEVFNGMASLKKGFRRMSYEIIGDAFSQEQVDEWYDIGIAHRVSKMRAKVNSLTLNINY
jgi:hypothetical protein